MKIECIAIDDEPLALEIISAFCLRFPFLNMLRTFDSSSEAQAFLKNNQVDLLFLDVQMEGMTGIELVRSLDYQPFVILTTGQDLHAVKSFGIENADYLLKPFSFDRFSECVNRMYNRISNSGSL